MGGYTDSQTWQAWLESSEVLWNNTSLIFLTSVGMSLAVVFFTWIINSSSKLSQVTTPCQETEKKHGEETEDTLEEDKEKIEQEKMEVDQVMEYSQHLPGQVKKAHQHSLEKNIHPELTDEQRAAEREAQSQQLAAIFRMMQEQEEKFGETTMDDIKDQMKLYCG